MPFALVFYLEPLGVALLLLCWLLQGAPASYPRPWHGSNLAVCVQSTNRAQTRQQQPERQAVALGLGVGTGGRDLAGSLGHSGRCRTHEIPSSTLARDSDATPRSRPKAAGAATPELDAGRPDRPRAGRWPGK